MAPNAVDSRIAELAEQGYPVREISEMLGPEGYKLGKSAVAERLRRLRGETAPRSPPAPLRAAPPNLARIAAPPPPAVSPGSTPPPEDDPGALARLLARCAPPHAPPSAPGRAPRLLVHEITPETADMLRRGRAYFEPSPDWTEPAPPWGPELEPWTLVGVRHDIACNPRVAAAVMVEGSVVDAAWGWYEGDANGLEPPDMDLVRRALRHPYELARAVAHVVGFGEEREDGPAAEGEPVPLEEQLRAGLALLAAAAEELRAMAQRAAEERTAKGHPETYPWDLTTCDGWRRSVVDGWGVCEEWEDEDDEDDAEQPADDAEQPADDAA